MRGLGEDRLWIWKSVRPFELPNTPTSNRVIDDSFREQEEAKLFLVSDASVHVGRGKAAGPWQLFEMRSTKHRVV